MPSRLVLRGSFALLAALSAALGCSWQRFDDVSENAPVVTLRKPKGVGSGFGSALSAISLPERSVLLVSAAPGSARAASFDLGLSDDPSRDATDGDYCDSAESPCLLAASPAALADVELLDGDSSPLCFAVGIGSTETTRGVVVDCELDRLRLLLPVPAEYDEQLTFALEEQPEGVAMASDSGPSPSLLVASSEAQLAWFYASLRAAPELLPTPELGEGSFGAAVAAARLGDERVFAVAAPNERHVHLYRVPADSAAEYWGCLAGGAAFGRALTVGPVTAGDDDPELLVSDGASVHVYELSKLLAERGPEFADCASDALGQGALVASLQCDTAADTGSCEVADFGAASAIGDLDGDGDGEVIVGAPNMTIRGKESAGAMLVFDVEGQAPAALTEIKYISSADEDDRLGSSLAAPHLEGRDVIAAGAPGGGKAFVFYCSDLIPETERSARCR